MSNLTFRCLFCDSSRNINYLYGRFICSRCVKRHLLGKGWEEIKKIIDDAEKAHTDLNDYIDIDDMVKK